MIEVNLHVRALSIKSDEQVIHFVYQCSTHAPKELLGLINQINFPVISYYEVVTTVNRKQSRRLKVHSNKDYKLLIVHFRAVFKDIF